MTTRRSFLKLVGAATAFCAGLLMPWKAKAEPGNSLNVPIKITGTDGPGKYRGIAYYQVDYHFERQPDGQIKILSINSTPIEIEDCA